MYWLTAKHQTYLGNGIQIEKGQQFMLNINTMGAKPSFIFSTPERRKQAIEQFKNQGYDLSKREYLLNSGNWEISTSPLVELSKSYETLTDRERNQSIIFKR
jgi:hypothetical protein